MPSLVIFIAFIFGKQKALPSAQFKNTNSQTHKRAPKTDWEESWERDDPEAWAPDSLSALLKIKFVLLQCHTWVVH